MQEKKYKQTQAKKKSANRLRDSFQVSPHWQCLEKSYSLQEVFAFFGPYRGASIIPRAIDERTIEVRMPLVVDNENYVGTQFGGSLYSMCDPFYMLLLIRLLGDNYMVWDKNASIEFVRPGKSEVHVVFQITSQEIETIKQLLSKEKKTTRVYTTEIFDADGKVVAKVSKELYIRRLSEK